MKLLTFSRGSDKRIGVLHEGRVIDFRATASAMGADVPEVAELRDLARVEFLPALAEFASMMTADPARAVSFGADDVVLHAPFRPRQNIICAGGNTRDEFSSERIRGGRPWVSYYTKAATAVVDPGEPITFPRRITSQVYAQPELAVIMGADTSYVPEDAALSHVFGYSVATNVCAADLKRKHGQWDKAVSLDTFLPWGPVVITADEVALSDLSCRLWLNDRMAITGRAEAGLLTTAQIVSELSHGISLRPGDVILTGAAESIGHGQLPERWLSDGDVVRAAVEEIGALENPVRSY